MLGAQGRLGEQSARTLYTKGSIAMSVFEGRRRAAASAEAPEPFECDGRRVYDADTMDEYVTRLRTRIAMLDAQLQQQPATRRLRAQMDLVRRRVGTTTTAARDDAPFSWLDEAGPQHADVDFWDRTYADADFLTEIPQR
jgi:hypothetical protein